MLKWVLGSACIVVLSAAAVFSDTTPAAGGGFAAKHPQLAAKFHALPDWQKQEIKQVIKRAHFAIKAVKANPKLTEDQKQARIKEIKKRVHERIMKILHSDAPLAKGAGAR